MANKNVYIIAGPNGAGKTTFAKIFMPAYAKCQNFVNADLIATGLSPFSPRSAAMKAGRLVLEEVHKLAEKDVDFAFETTLSGKSYIRFLKELKAKGYLISIFFLWIPTYEFATQRIKYRVAAGGHGVPAEDVRRRFDRGLDNFFHHYRPMADTWMLFNNAGAAPQLIAQNVYGKLEILNDELFGKIKGSRV